MAQNQNEGDGVPIGQSLEARATNYNELRSDDAIVSVRRYGTTRHYWISSDVLEISVDDVEGGSGHFANRVRNQFEGAIKIDDEQKELVEAIDTSIESVWGVSLEPELAGTLGTDRDAKIPIYFVAEGKPLTAAYLRAHDWSNIAISHVLDVSESTVSQYVSDFKNGRR